MKLPSASAVLISLLISPTKGFVPTTPYSKQHAVLSHTRPPTPKQQQFQLNSMKPEDMEKMMSELENMSDDELDKLKALGMDPIMMKKSMQMMKDNPSVMDAAQKVMSKLTPEQMLEQSRLAQERMKSMSPEDLDRASKAMETLDVSQMEEAAKVYVEKGLPGGASDASVIDTMFRVGEIMSSPPSGGVTYQAFATLPPITVLSGNREEDLSPSELAECWADGSLGATRVDRTGFERVWNEVRDYFEGDIMEEARKTIAKKKSKKSRGSDDSGTIVTSSTAPATQTTTTPVGANLSSDQVTQLNEQVKAMSDDDVSSMLDQMDNMTPEQEQRLKSMGVDPSMMKKTASMMKNNPMMRQAAQAMMKNMTPDQMLKASRQAQEQIGGMSKEEYEKALDRLNKGES